ncbi:MAG TPA: tetratricopeptide repeat protein, partial [Pyrinomonadaceae bacterium]|nr:tetratricopeptide repeat protein [Pyrinomonadaceae bacterium]
MNTRPALLCAFIFLLLFCFVSNVNSQAVRKTPSANEITDPQTAITELRKLYKMRDFECGYERGKKFVERFPQDMELNALFIQNMARSNMNEEAVKVAEKLIENDKENAWAWFALATSYLRNSQNKEAVPAVEKALKLMPDHEDFIFLHASLLMAQKKYDEIYVWLDKNSSKIKDQSKLLQIKGNAQYRQSAGGKLDEAKRRMSFETFAKAIELSPNFVYAIYLYGSYLNQDKRFAEALPHLKKAAALSPRVAHIREALWRAMLNGQPDKTEEYRKTEVIADMESLMRLRPDSINVLETVGLFYERDLKMREKKRELEAVILKKFPQSMPAERLLYFKIRGFNVYGKDNKVDEQKKQQLVSMLKDFINRPQHYQKSY